MINKIFKPNDLWALSITITGKCNASCDYCHFYAKKERKKYNFDLSKEILKDYTKLIKYINENVHQNLQVRFSGGEPLMAGDFLFEAANYIYQETGIEPFALSNGLAINQDVIEKSIKNHLFGFFVSIENPFNPAIGAPNTAIALQKIKQYNSEQCWVEPAMMVIKNEDFKDLERIADYIFAELGTIPPFSELTFQAFEIPSEQQLHELSENVKKICQKYYKIAPLRFMPYISPEFFLDGVKNFLTELDLENSINVHQGNLAEISERLYHRVERSYRPNPCNDSSCPWFEDCRYIKWLWFEPNNNLTPEMKLQAFCKMRKVLNQAIYDGIMASERVLELSAE